MIGLKIFLNKHQNIILTLIYCTLICFSCEKNSIQTIRPNCIKSSEFVLGTHKKDINLNDFTKDVNSVPFEKGGEVFFCMKKGPAFNPYGNPFYQSILLTKWLSFDKNEYLRTITFSYTYSAPLGEAPNKNVSDFINAIHNHEIPCLDKEMFKYNTKFIKDHENYIERFVLRVGNRNIPSLSYVATLK